VFGTNVSRPYSGLNGKEIVSPKRRWTRFKTHNIVPVG
jgi:hypothetical protein